jgi:hypothetical protein
MPKHISGVHDADGGLLPQAQQQTEMSAHRYVHQNLSHFLDGQHGKQKRQTDRKWHLFVLHCSEKGHMTSHFARRDLHLLQRCT